MIKKNVVHLTNAIGINKGGGVKSFIVDYLQSSNDENTLIFIGNKKDKESLGYLNANVINFEFRNLLTIIKVLKEADCVFQHSLWRHISLLTLFSKIVLKKVTIIQPHGVLNSNAFRNKKYIKLIYYHLIEKFNLGACDYVILNSDLECQESIQFLDINKIRLIYLGVKTSFIEDTSYDKHAYQDKFSSNSFLYISRLHPIKGLENLIQAFIEIDKLGIDFKFVIAGNGDLEYTSNLKTLIATNNLSSKILMVGFADENLKLELLSESKFFILPSFSESFSLSIAEALGRNVPVITTPNTLWKDYLPDYCGFVTLNDRESLKNTIIESLNLNEEAYIRMSKNAGILIRNKFIFEDNISIMYKLYKE